MKIFGAMGRTRYVRSAMNTLLVTARHMLYGQSFMQL